MHTMTASDLRDEASAAYQAGKELGPDYEQAVLESFVARAAESIDERVDARLAQRGVGQAPRSPHKQGKDQQPDNSHMAVPVFSVIFGVGASIWIWLSAGAGADPAEAVFAMWLGLTMINIAFGRLLKKLR
jgi:hypothetical protein